MTIAYWCILVMILLPYVFTFLAKSQSTYNNRKPREYLDNVTGWRKRAHYVQLNSFETTPAFAVAIIIAELTNVNQTYIDYSAIFYVLMRICYSIFYVTDHHVLRSTSWFLAMITIVALFFMH